MDLVIIESPYAAFGDRDITSNVIYARACMKDCLMRGEAPYASHLLYTQSHVLNDSIPEERTLGIHAGFAWRQVADKTVVYADFGITPGMQYGIDDANKRDIPVEIRLIFNDKTTSKTVPV